MALRSGSRLGSYEVIAALGAGGMGEVYRARDSRLKREVALKVLPEAVSQDPEALARFRREAELLATLNHPNIATIHGLEEADGIIAIVMELVEGETLAERIAGRRPRTSGVRPRGSGVRPQAAGSGSVEAGGPQPGAGLPLDEALAIARQIADALDTAHERGIIHRDLKPANIKLRGSQTPASDYGGRGGQTPASDYGGRGGQTPASDYGGLTPWVKVLDFGLAKMIERPGASGAAGPSGDGSRGVGVHRDPSPASSLSPTLTLSTPLGGTPVQRTHEGTILGTPAYMSPEQARGKPVDRRTDIWAFGCILFEMLSGKDAFETGDTVSDAIAAILTTEPDWTALPADLPGHIRTLLRRCLQKDQQKRLRDIGDARIQIDEGPMDASATAFVVPPARTRPAWQRAVGPAVVAAFAATIGGVGVWRFTPSEHLPVVTRFSFPLPDGQQFSRPGHQLVAISPDGTHVVYAASGRLYLRSMSELEARPIPGTDSTAENPAFSPDGQSIVFGSRADNALKRIAVTGGAPTTICPAGAVFGLSWAWDGSILFGQEQGVKGILRVSANGGTPEVVVAVKGVEDAHGPHLLPDGQHVLFTLATGTGSSRWDTAQIVVQSLKSGERKTLITGGTDARYLPTGHIVYGLGGVVYAVPFDPRRLELTGGPVPIVEGVRSSGRLSGSQHFSVSSTGSLIYVPGPVSMSSEKAELGIVDRKGTIEKLKLPAGGYATPRVSPDGKRLAVGVEDGKDSDIWIYELSGGSSMRRLTFGGRNGIPIWSPDSRRVAFQSHSEGDAAIFLQTADGSGAAERLTTPDQGASHSPESWSPDGAHILFNATKASTVSLWALSLQDKKAVPFGSVRSSEPTNAVFSPDGRWVAYTSTDGGRRIFVQPFPATGAKYEVASNEIYPVWSAAGNELATWGNEGLHIVSVATRPSFTVGIPVEVPSRVGVIGPSAPRTYDITPDGRFIGIIAAASNPANAVADPTFKVVLNWFEELKAKTARAAATR